MAQTSRLSRAKIESTRAPEGGDVWLSDDDGSRGGGRLAIRISSNGSRLWYFRYSVNGKRALIPMGRYARPDDPEDTGLTLEKARAQARSYGDIYRNPETRGVKAHIQQAARPPAPSAAATTPLAATSAANATLVDGPTLLDVCNAYEANLKARGKTSVKDVASYFRVHVAPTEWAALPAASITSKQVARLLNAVVKKGHNTTAAHLQRALHAAFEVALSGHADPRTPIQADDGPIAVTSNPVAGTVSLSEFLVPRNRRPPSDTELGHVWLALTTGPGRDLLQTRFIRTSILLGGQRCEQLLRCTTSSVDLEKRTVLLFDPKGRRKVPRPHLLPLTPLAFQEVEFLIELASDLGSPWLFPGKDVTKPMSSGPVSRAMKRISDRLQADHRKLTRPYRYDDIRSTIETDLASKEVSGHTRAQVQSHGISGVQAKHYDLWEYMPEKRRTLLMWEAHLLRCAELAARQDDSTAAVSSGSTNEMPAEVPLKQTVTRAGRRAKQRTGSESGASRA